MTYHHVPGHPVADIYEDRDEEAGIIEMLRGFGGTLPPRSQSAHATEHPVEAEEEYQHTPVPPQVWDIYEEYLTRSRFKQAVINAGKRWGRIKASGRYSVHSGSKYAAEHLIEAEEGWLGSTDADDDDPGGWAR